MEVDERIPQLTRLTLENLTLVLTADGPGYVATVGDRTYRLAVLSSQTDRLQLLIDDRRLVAYVSTDARTHWITVNGRTFRLARSAAPSRTVGTHRGPAELTAPMPGQVRAVNVSAGEIVTKGQLMVVLEAMKMEIRLSAPFDAEVISLDVRLDETVEREQIIARLQPR